MEKEIINIIIVEDDIDQQKMYKDCIDEFNKEDAEYEIEVFQFKDDSEVPNTLYNHRIDAIIIDLNWGNGSLVAEGSMLVDKIREDCRVPIFIISGNLGLFESDYEETIIFKKYQRDSVDFEQVLEEIKELYRTGYTKAIGNGSKLDKMIGEVFWQHMSKVIAHWKDFDEEIKVQRMLRFAATRINEMLTKNGEDKHDYYDAVEFYITQSENKKIFTGDIINYESEQYIVMTAACDIENDKSDYVVLCKIDNEILNDIYTGLKEDNTKAKSNFDGYIKNNKQRYHLLPPCDLFPSGAVDFQCIKSVPKNEIESLKSDISINPVFVKDIQARFSHYYGRQGQPQLNKDSIIEWIKEKI